VTIANKIIMKKIALIVISIVVFTILTGIFSYIVICLLFASLHIFFRMPMVGFDYAFYVSFFFCCPVGSTIGISWYNWRFGTEKFSIIAIATGSVIGYLAARYLSHVFQYIGIGPNLGALLTFLLIIMFSFMGYYLGKSIKKHINLTEGGN
jgi:hypothetical protein